MNYGSVLVTGCGGDIGLSIAKILKEAGVSREVWGCDIHDKYPQEIYDRTFVVPKAYEKGYLEKVEGIDADILIPTSEAELCFFNELGYSAIMANQLSLNVGLDKLETVLFLEEAGLPFPKTGELEHSSPKEFPCIIKSRFGQGSKDVRIVDEELCAYYASRCENFIWQELLLPANEEYTCGLYRTKAGETRTIVFKRELKGGLTGYAEVIENNEIDKLLVRIADGLKLNGAINVQLRLTKDGPVVFEINPRFSSTVYFRHALGFKDLIWSLEEQEGKSLSEYVKPKANTRIFRGSKEYVME